MDQKLKKRRKPPVAPNDFVDFRRWLNGLDMINPVLHVNGPGHGGAVVTVDFGTPLVEQKLTPEQNAELVSRMRSATRALYQEREVSVRIQTDANNGVWWSSIG